MLESLLVDDLELLIAISQAAGECNHELAERIVEMFGEALDSVKAEMDAKRGNV